jgi:phage/plasmid-like protein (TIGR03299 family)
MPANVESMYSVREMPWHGEGYVPQEYPGSWAEARKWAGLEWDPVSFPVYDRTEHPDGIPEYAPQYSKVDGYNIIKRSDTGAVLSVRPSSYAVIDHRDMGEIIEAVLEQPNVKWETAGCLDGGKAVWCLALLDEPVQLPGDPSATYPYMAITNRHDGTAACALRSTMVRIVCGNTFRASEMEGERTGATFSFTHRAGWRDRIAEAREAVTGARAEMRAYVELAEELLRISVTAEQREHFVLNFIPMPPETLITDRVARNVEAARAAVRGILASPTTEGVRGTAYELVQTGVEYADHLRGYRSRGTYLSRTMLRPEPLKARTLTLVRELVASS